MIWEEPMSNFAILCLDDNPINVENYQQELAHFADCFDVHCVDSLTDANQTLEYIHQLGQSVALVIGCHHDGLNGADFLIQLDKHDHTKRSRKLLINSGQDLQTVLDIVNEGRLDHCLTTPITNNLLYKTVQKELTTFVIEHASGDLLTYSHLLDQTRLLRAHIDRSMHNYRQGFISDYHTMSDDELAENVIIALYDFFRIADDTHACRTYSSNHLLTKEGDENQFLWFITNGEVALFKKDDTGKQREVVRHKKGNLIGGMSFVTGEPSFSTGITLTKTHVIKLDRAVFAKVMHSNSQLLPLFTNLLLRHFNRRLQRSITTKLELQKTLESLESAQQQLIDHEKMAVLGELIAGVAHELNNPVAAILRGAETLCDKINTILLSNGKDEQYQQGIELLNLNLKSQPTSTSIAREKTRQLEAQIHDRLLAKKMVKLGLEQHQAIIELATKHPDQAHVQLSQLENFALTGSSLRSIAVCAQRIADMVKSLKGYAREDDEKYYQTDIHEGLEDTLTIFENQLKHHTVTTEYQTIPTLFVQPNALQQVWTNLISNALDAIRGQSGEIHVTTKLVDYDKQAFVEVSIADNGSGIEHALIEKIFELNFTTKKEGNFGLGIGLSVCQQIVRQHQGWIDVNSVIDVGTKVSVNLPVYHSVEQQKEA
jgi:signal transduction histidine kinase